MARRLLVPDGAVKETEVKTGGLIRRYDSSDGYVTVRDDEAAALRANGFTDASPAGAFARSSGRRCTSCGFGSFFTTCSRCGGTCTKEER